MSIVVTDAQKIRFKFEKRGHQHKSLTVWELYTMKTCLDQELTDDPWNGSMKASTSAVALAQFRWTIELPANYPTRHGQCLQLLYCKPNIRTPFCTQHATLLRDLLLHYYFHLHAYYIGVGAGPAGLFWPDHFFGNLMKFIIDGLRAPITARPLQKSFLHPA